MLKKTLVLLSAKNRKSDILFNPHDSSSSSSRAETSSSAETLTDSSNTKSQLSCSIRQPEAHSSLQSDHEEQNGSEERRPTRQLFTPYVRPSSATDADEDSAPVQIARVESSSASAVSIGLKSILRKRRGVNKVVGGAAKKKKVTLLITERSDSKQNINKDDSLTENSTEIKLNSESSDYQGNDEINVSESSENSCEATSSATRRSKASSHKLRSRRKLRNMSKVKGFRLQEKRLERNFRRYKTCFELGFKAEKILSARHDGDNIYFVIKYRDFDELELVPSHIVRSHEPLMVFDYYDRQFCWSQLQTNKYTL